MPGDRQSVSRLSSIMMLTLSIVTLAAVQAIPALGGREDHQCPERGRPASHRLRAIRGEAMGLVIQSIQTVNDNAITDIDSMASVTYLFPGVLDRDSGGVYSTWSSTGMRTRHLDEQASREATWGRWRKIGGMRLDRG